jgi:hypothetical protein
MSKGNQWWHCLALVMSTVALTSAPVHAAFAQAAPTASARVVKPKARTATGGRCLNDHKGTLGGVFGPSALPPLAFTIGPGSAMADQMHASKAPFTGPGRYHDVIVMVYLGKDALHDTYGGLGTVTVNADDRTGSFALNDGTASGTWDCGTPAR